MHSFPLAQTSHSVLSSRQGSAPWTADSRANESSSHEPMAVPAPRNEPIAMLHRTNSRESQHSERHVTELAQFDSATWWFHASFRLRIVLPFFVCGFCDGETGETFKPKNSQELLLHQSRSSSRS